MQTTFIIYLSVWILVIVPLIAFNMKRIVAKNLDGTKKIRWVGASVILALAVFLSFFLFSAYQTTLNSRYEIAGEWYAEQHARYLTGQFTYEEYVEATKDRRNGTPPPPQEVLDVPGTNLGLARFQIGDWITPAKFEDAEGFPETDIINRENNPVFLFYSMSDGTNSIYYMIRMQSDDRGQHWQITYHDLIPEAVDNDSRFNSFRPNAKSGKWFEIFA